MTTTIGGSYPAVNSDSDATINGLTVGKGGGAVSTNTAVGNAALGTNASGGEIAAFGIQALRVSTVSNNTALGAYSMYNTTTGTESVSVGRRALFTNTTGGNNVAVGDVALNSNTTGGTNTAVGGQALLSNTTASNNTAVGYQSLSTQSGSTGPNDAFGYQALKANTTGYYNQAFGGAALVSNTTGSQNTAIGFQALTLNTTGGQNIAVGPFALNKNTTGTFNVGMGYNAGYNTTTGANNVSIGGYALQANTTASNNTAIGYEAGTINTGGDNTFVGYYAGKSITSASQTVFVGAYSGQNTTGSNNTFVGYGAGYVVTSGTKNTLIGVYNGNQGGLDIRTASNYIVLSDGDGNIKQVIDPQGCVVIPGYGAPNVVRTGDASLSVYKNVNTLRVAHFQNNFNTSGAENVRTVLGSNCDNTASYHLIASTGGADKYYLYGNGTFATVSDERLKKNIEDAKEGYLDDVMKLRVVKYNWAEDAENTPKELGWIAQEVEQVFPRLVQDCLPNEDGDIYKTVKTSVLPHILLKAIQELNAKVEAQALEIATLKGN
jgi:hypothetical protein